MNENVICDNKARCLDFPKECYGCEHNEKKHYFKKREHK
jgi:hypothetical protein